MCLSFIFSSTIPSEPSGPSGTIFKYDLLDTSFGGTHGAFNAIDWESLYGTCTAWNNELQCYQPDYASQDSTTGEITITATRGDDDQIYSARFEKSLFLLTLINRFPYEF